MHGLWQHLASDDWRVNTHEPTLRSFTAGQTVTTADFFGMFAFYTTLENPLILVGHMAMTVSAALVTIKYEDWSQVWDLG
jgi:hypothetical protein